MGFHRFLTAAMDGRPLARYGDGEQTRDFTYVANVVDGVLRACEAPDAAGQVINVATGGRISLNQLFRTVRDLVGADLEPIYEPPRAGDVKDSQADIGKAARVLGYEPRVSFDEGLARTVEWYRTSQVTVA
jgi:nucleoside-diphosphate-sugar epimerase